MKRLVACLALVPLLGAADRIEAFGKQWQVPIQADWKLEQDALKLLVARPSTAPRRPTQFALADTTPYTQVTIEADVKRLGGSLILVYAYRDENHFNYAHLSRDRSDKVPYHNGIFHVYGGDRVRISSEAGEAALPSEDWHHVKLEYDGTTGLVQVFVNGKTTPALKGVDLSLGVGRVGIGSFFETAEFKNVVINGK